jgi:hypothetical protein
MTEQAGQIIVGVLGQWASGKTTASSILVQYLGGKEEVIFINDRALLANLAVNYILELEESEVQHIVGEDGSQDFRSELVSIFLRPGEELTTADLNMLLFDLHDGIYDNVPLGSYNWMDLVRIEMGKQILQESAVGKPIVIEAGFGTNSDPSGENPFSHSITDLFLRLEETGIEPDLVKWIIIEASYDIRSQRNQAREDTVPAVEFDRFAADGGDLEPDEQVALESRGAVLKRVPNNHHDVGIFKADIVARFRELFPN